MPSDPRAPTGLNLRTAHSGGSGTGATRTNSSGTGAHPSGPGTAKLPNGGSKSVNANGSSVERNRSGKITGVTTAKGATAKMDSHGRASRIHDGKGTTISRGPHGERKIETTRADHSRLVSNGRHGGYLERRYNRDGHEYVQRAYYVNGRAYTRVYAPYYYLRFPYYGYIPAYYYAPAFYGWVYNPWPAPVVYAWGWYGAPWYAPYGYYFAPYPVYPAPAFWLADYALAASLQAAAEDAESGSLRSEPGFVYASAPVSPQNQGKGSPLLSSAIKDQIAEEVKQIIADEKDAAGKQGAAAVPAVPPSLDPRFTLFIVSSELSLDTETGTCSVTAGDIVRRKDFNVDADRTVSVEVVSSKNDDCAVGAASRLKLDDLEEMHDSLREKVDAGMKSLSENQGKTGIPTGPAAAPAKVAEGQADPDPTVGDELKKQQEAADAAEKDVQEATKESGSAD